MIQHEIARSHMTSSWRSTSSSASAYLLASKLFVCPVVPCRQFSHQLRSQPPSPLCPRACGRHARDSSRIFISRLPVFTFQASLLQPVEQCRNQYDETAIPPLGRTASHQHRHGTTLICQRQRPPVARHLTSFSSIPSFSYSGLSSPLSPPRRPRPATPRR